MPHKKLSTRHHLIPKSRRSSLKHEYSESDFDRTIRLWSDRHQYWHYLFKNMTLDEIILCLQRVKKTKFK